MRASYESKTDYNILGCGHTCTAEDMVSFTTLSNAINADISICQVFDMKSKQCGFEEENFEFRDFDKDMVQHLQEALPSQPLLGDPHQIKG